MVKTVVGIEGMMCPMCESHVNDAIRKAFEVKKVEASHKKKECVIISDEEIDEEKIRSVIDETGYSVKSFSSEPFSKKGIFGKLKL